MTLEAVIVMLEAVIVMLEACSDSDVRSMQ